jgi:hypothetical protein
MTEPSLSKVSILRRFVDERYLERRLRSSSVAGFTASFAAVALFEYRYFNNHIWNWDLLAVALIFVVMKLLMRLWYWFKD